MATPTTSPQDWPALGQAFADYLEETNLYPGLKTVQCGVQSGRLVLVARHGSPEIDDPHDLLRELESIFIELMPGVGLPDATWIELDAVPVRVGLQLKSAAQPYATHTFTWRLEDAANTLFPIVVDPIPAMANGEGQGSNGLGSRADSQPIGEPLEDSPFPTAASGSEARDRVDGADPGASLPGEVGPARQAPSDVANGYGPSPSLSDEFPSPGPPFSDRAIALPDATIEPPNNFAWLKGGWIWTVDQLYALSQYWIYGLAGLIVVGSGIFAYALSRPCVVGSCERLGEAEDFYGDAQLQGAGNPDQAALQTAQSDLQTAIELLTPIPQWSPYYEQAQANLQQYQGNAAALNALAQAKDRALEAAVLSQDPPHSVERWVDVQLLWQQAVDLLETIPPDSPAYDYAQQKLEEYQANHKAIGRRIVAEEEAEANFSTAIQTGQLAQQRMETAESLAGWQLAAKEWQAAIKGLSVIPQGTSAYSEAQTYLQDYQQKFARASAQANIEESSTLFYQQAVQSAREAKAYEAKSQWTLAVTEWQRAVIRAQQISPESILGSEAAALLETYQPALTSAQNRLRTAVALQTLTQTVGSVCQGSATPCNVTEDPSQIQVTLASQYAEPLRQAITPPAADGTFAFTNQLTPEVQALIDEIITVSHQVDRQVAIYDSHGGFVARYRPDLGGFIKN